MITVLVWLRRPAPPMEAVLAALKELGARTRHAYPGAALVVDIPDEQLGAASQIDGVRTMCTKALSADEVSAETPEDQAIIKAWNRILLSSEKRQGEFEPVESWDAPGRLPPDPPREIRERLRRREAESPGTEEG